MAKSHSERLRKRYNWAGGNYKDIVSQIISDNNNRIAETMASLSRENYERGFRKIKKTEKRFIIPDIRDVIPAEGIVLRKAAESGRSISKELGDGLMADLDEILREVTPKTKEPRIITRRGIRAGRINPELIKKFENKILERFQSYTKRDPKFGVPPNVHQIAVTEVRSVVNPIKQKYAEELEQRNVGKVEMYKIWKHNIRQSRNPRAYHRIMNGRRVRMNENFIVPHPDGGFTSMSHPHDPTAPAEQVIGCNCDVEYIAVRVEEPEPV